MVFPAASSIVSNDGLSLLKSLRVPQAPALAWSAGEQASIQIKELVRMYTYLSFKDHADACLGETLQQEKSYANSLNAVCRPNMPINSFFGQRRQGSNHVSKEN